MKDFRERMKAAVADARTRTAGMPGLTQEQAREVVAREQSPPPAAEKPAAEKPAGFWRKLFQ